MQLRLWAKKSQEQINAEGVARARQALNSVPKRKITFDADEIRLALTLIAGLEERRYVQARVKALIFKCRDCVDSISRVTITGDID